MKVGEHGNFVVANKEVMCPFTRYLLQKDKGSMVVGSGVIKAFLFDMAFITLNTDGMAYKLDLGWQ